MLSEISYKGRTLYEFHLYEAPEQSDSERERVEGW